MNRKSILIATKELTEVVNLCDQLGSTYECLYVSDGRRAVEEISKGGIDAIILGIFISPLSTTHPKFHDYKGDAIAKSARKNGFNGPIVLRSRSAMLFEESMAHLNVYCISGLDKKNDENIYHYLNEQFGHSHLKDNSPLKFSLENFE